MNTADKTAFGKTLLAVAEMYSKTLSPQVLELYWRCLMDYSLADIKQAFNQHAKHPAQGMFMPKPANLIRLLDGDYTTQALKAWTKLLNAIANVGVYRSIVFDDALLHNTILDMGGWIYLGSLRDEQLQYRTREFERRYSGYLEQHPSTHPCKLIGVYEKQNNVAGFNEENEPVLFGNTDRAYLVYSEGKLPTTYLQAVTASAKPLSYYLIQNTLTQAKTPVLSNLLTD